MLKNHMMSCEKQFFTLCPKYRTKPHLDFNNSYYYLQ